MIPLPPNPATGFPILDWARAAQETLRRLRVSAGPGIRLVETSGGIILSARPKPGETTPDPSPWDIHSLTGVGEPDAEGKYSSYKGKVWPGTVQGFLPSNIANNNGLTEFTVGAALTYWICTITSDGKTVTGATISTATAPPAAQVPTNGALPSPAAFVFGLTLNGTAWRTVGNASASSSLVMTIENEGEDTQYWYVWSFL